MDYWPTIGLEIHVELKTKTKMFCSCLNDPNESHPNINICPVCMGHPGTLPVINKEAVKKVLLVGKALNGKLSDYSYFDRKNYFYPDLPKGYQISQYKYPLVQDAELNGVKIRRIHLEEDTGSLFHKHSKTFINYNRAGVPLMELVTEPVIRFGKDARLFAENLRLILRYLDVSDADMEKGQMRVEVNISLNLKNEGREKLGTKVEIKNLNSFKSVENAIDFEIERQKKILEKGEKIIQETRGWDENKGITFSQRKKEESHDYRYFPEPDLPHLDLSTILKELPPLVELPDQKKERFKKEYNLREEQIDILILNKNMAVFFEEAASELDDKNTAYLLANYMITDLLSLCHGNFSEDLLVTPENMAELINMINNDEINSRAAKDILKIMFQKGGDPSIIAEEMNIKQINDFSFIDNIIEEVLKENPRAIEDYRKGKLNSIQFLVGQIMKKSKGKINPEILISRIKDKIS